MTRRLSSLPLVLMLLAPATTSPAPAGEPAPVEVAPLLDRVRQLTFDGRRAGEGYFSSDGRKLVFQSEREPGNPFFQIFELDFETGATRRVSPGHGKTTCAFYRPGSDEILFASTHHDPRSERLQRDELELRASGRERRYEWDYDAEMELWVEDGESGALRRLTEARGYDAEASYSPDGKWIVFTSNRAAYASDLTDDERRMLESDPAYFADIYLMPADGGEAKRLTDEPGYDGGPFFMPDGERIVWRRFDERGLIADIWTMALDGSARLQLTDFGAMSWAPYPHPSGRYVLFTSNKHGFENFELFMVDSAGRKEPVRVTQFDGFDGLPVPSPDGRKLVWTARRPGADHGQLFVADWDHAAALAALESAPDRRVAP